MYILICRKTERTEPTVDAVNNTTEANGEWRLSGSREKQALGLWPSVTGHKLTLRFTGTLLD